MYVRKNHELSAPTDADFIAELDRFSVPFGVQLEGRFIATPPVAWTRVFNGPAGTDGLPINAGGIPAHLVKVMRRVSGEHRILHPQANLCFWPTY